MPEMEIFKTFRFDSAHQLTGVPPTHRCANMHGHGYELTVYLRGPVDPVTGFVLDFGDLATVCDPLIKQLDHAVLNHIPGLENPTSENLSAWIWNKLKPQLPLLSKLMIQETPTSGCTYCGE